MRKLFTLEVVFTCFLITARVHSNASVTDVHSIHCGSRLAIIGMRQGEVLALCGEPLSVRSWQEVVEGEDRVQNREHHFSAVLILNYEEWIYNFGPNRFIQYLLFRNGTLVTIQFGGYGY